MSANPTSRNSAGTLWNVSVTASGSKYSSSPQSSRTPLSPVKHRPAAISARVRTFSGWSAAYVVDIVPPMQ